MKSFKRRIMPRNDIPDHPGLYYWSEYRALVTVTMRRGGLYVTPPIKGGVEIKITPNIAGRFEKRR